jgi:myo-inositol 2-dehydrogenase/D-chiro-inositol 1-dehydrogenase
VFAPHAEAQEPPLVEVDTQSGVLVNVDSFVHCGYGYDVRCELVGSSGVLGVGYPASKRSATSERKAVTVSHDWNDRFAVRSPATDDVAGLLRLRQRVQWRANAWAGTPPLPRPGGCRVTA